MRNGLWLSTLIQPTNNVFSTGFLLPSEALVLPIHNWDALSEAMIGKLLSAVKALISLMSLLL